MTLANASVRALSDADQTALLFTTNMGLEDVVVAEFEERCVDAGQTVAATQEQPFDLNSYALVESPAPLDALMPIARQMRSVHHVLAPLYVFEVPAVQPLETIRSVLASVDVPAMTTARTFRVTSVRNGDHDFTSIDVQTAAGAGLQDQYDTEVDLEVFDLEVRVDVHDARGLVSIQHTQEALSRRHLEGFQPRAALKANVAYALLRLAHLDAPTVLLDPFCGSGTILLEAADLWLDTRGYGNDWSDEVVAGARHNVTLADRSDRITIREGDVWHLADTFADVTADLIVTNPPFGVRIGSSMDFFPFYRRVLAQMAAVLRPEGRVVMLVLKQGPFNGALRDTGLFDVRHVRVIEMGGLYPRVFVLGRIADD
jgi:putative N6-adenine-specific DNA methylase/tRNA (guanine6-N2)-methyltransferase